MIKTGSVTVIARVLVLMAACFSVTRAGAGERAYSVGIVPQFDPVAVHRVWRPALEKLGEISGYSFSVKSYRGFRAFIDDLRAGRVDFAYLAPFHLIVAKRAQGYVPLLRNDDAPLVGVLVVARDGPIQALADLRGKTIDFPSPQAFAASVLLRARLREGEKLSFTPRYVGTHGNVYRHVVFGQAAAGGGVNFSLAREPSVLRDKLRVLYKTEAVPSHPIAAHPRVPAEVRLALVAAIKSLSASEAGQGLLKGIPLTRPVEADYQRDYSFLEKQDFTKYFDEDGG